MQKQNSRRMAIGHPPQFVPTLIVHKKLRFKATTGFAIATPLVLNSQSIADLYCAAATATSAYRIASHVRVRKIEMWAPMAADLVPVSITLDWTGSTLLGGFGKSNRVSDTSMGSSEPAHLVSSPPPNAQIAQWLSPDSNGEICRLSFPSSTVIDLTFDLVVRDDGTASAVTGAVAGATVGAIYVRSLDSVAGTATVPPVSLSTI